MKERSAGHGKGPTSESSCGAAGWAAGTRFRQCRRRSLLEGNYTGHNAYATSCFYLPLDGGRVRRHAELLEQRNQRLPPGARQVVRGDGALRVPRHRSVRLHQHQPQMRPGAIGHRRLVAASARSAGEQLLPVLRARPGLEREPRHLGEVAAQRRAIGGVARRLEPLVHFDTFLAHRAANHRHRHLEVGEWTARHLRQDGDHLFAAELVAGEVKALAGVARAVLQRRDHGAGNVADGHLHQAARRRQRRTVDALAQLGEAEERVLHEVDRGDDRGFDALRADVLLDGELAVEVRDAGVAVGVGDGRVDEVGAGGGRGVGGEDALARLGLGTVLVGRGDGEHRLHAGERAVDRGAVLQVALRELDAEGSERLRGRRGDVAREGANAMPLFDELPGDGSSLGSGRASHEYVEWLGHEASWYELDIKMLDVKKRIRYWGIHIHGLESSASGAAATHTFAYGGTT